MVDKLSKELEKVCAEMNGEDVPDSTPDEPTTTAKDEKKMATKKTPKKKVPTKKVKSDAKPKKVAASKEGMVSLKDVCKELKLDPRLARVKLRKAEIENPGRWAWKDGSGELTKVRKLLGTEK